MASAYATQAIMAPRVNIKNVVAKPPVRVMVSVIIQQEFALAPQISQGLPVKYPIIPAQITAQGHMDTVTQIVDNVHASLPGYSLIATMANAN